MLAIHWIVLGGAWVEQTHLKGTWWLSCAWLNPQLFFWICQTILVSAHIIRSSQMCSSLRLEEITLSLLCKYHSSSPLDICVLPVHGTPQHNYSLLCTMLFSSSSHTWILSKVCIKAPAGYRKTCPSKYRALLIEGSHIQYNILHSGYVKGKIQCHYWYLHYSLPFLTENMAAAEFKNYMVRVECSNIEKDNYCILISECDLSVELNKTGKNN